MSYRYLKSAVQVTCQTALNSQSILVLILHVYRPQESPCFLSWYFHPIFGLNARIRRNMYVSHLIGLSNTENICI